MAWRFRLLACLHGWIGILSFGGGGILGFELNILYTESQMRIKWHT